MTGRIIRSKRLFYEATTSISPEPWMAKAILFGFYSFSLFRLTFFILLFLFWKFFLKGLTLWPVHIGQVRQFNDLLFGLFIFDKFINSMTYSLACSYLTSSLIQMTYSLACSFFSYSITCYFICYNLPQSQ
jgi:hypothetical protein